MNSVFETHANQAPMLFDTLQDETAVPLKGTTFPRSPAVYVFLMDGKPVHVGRTRNLRQRLQGHRTNSHFSASFAFKRARAATGIAATYRKGEGRDALMLQPHFRTAFDAALEEVRGMAVRFLIVENPIDQYMLELYAALELGTSLTEFDTH